MARFIFFLAIFSMVYQSTIADDVERANINIVSKYGARNLINIPRPIDASDAHDIISCMAQKPTLRKKTLGEVTKSGKTRGHFISRKDNCSFELITTVDYGKWYISTEYYRKNDATIQTQQDIVLMQPSTSSIMKDFFVSARDSVNGSFTIPKSQQLEKVDMIKLSNDDADLKYQIYPINHHSSIFQNLVCANGECTVIFREWKDDYYGCWKVRTIAKDTGTHKWEQHSIIFEYKRPELKGARNETEEEIMSSKKIKTDVFQVSVGGRVSVHIESPERGQVVDCSVVYMENTNMRFDKKPGDYNDFIDFFKSGDCSFIMKDFGNDMYGKWQVTTNYKYNEDRFKSVTREQINIIHFEDKDEKSEQPREQHSIAFEYKRPELKGTRNETEEETMSMYTEKTKSDVFRVSVGGRLRVNIERPKRGQPVQCSVVNTNNDNMRFDKKPGEYDDYIDFFSYANCSFIMEDFDIDMYGEWQVTTTYKYNANRYRLVTGEQINIIHFEDKDEPAEIRIVSPDFEFTALPLVPGAEKILQVNAGEKLLLSPDNNSTGYVDRCEAVHVGEYEDTIYEIQPKHDSRLSYDYNGFYTNCNFTFSPFEAKYYGKWIVSSYYTYPKNSRNRVREDVVFQINHKQ